jgi:hypothetical protein
MKLILATVSGALVFFLLGGLFYGLLFKNFFDVNYALVGRAGDMKLWAIGLGCLTQALFMAWIYPHGYKGGSPMTEGMKFGLFIGLLISVPMIFFFWATFKVPIRAVVVDSAISGFMTIIAGIVIGLIYGHIATTTVTTERTTVTSATAP